MYSNIKTSIPDEILRDMNFEKDIFSIAKTDIMISTFSEHDGSNDILRIFQLLYNHLNETYEFVQELASFSFEDRSELVSFLNNLPELNGLEMLMLLNPISPSQSNLN